MVSPSSPLLIVLKRTGGKAWLKPWGYTGLTQTQKANKRQRLRLHAKNRDTLRAAEQRQWNILENAGQLPHWGESAEVARRRKLAADRRWSLWKAVCKQHVPSLEALRSAIATETA